MIAEGTVTRLFPGFKPFYQWKSSTRVIAGLDLIGSAGFEFAKEGASRALVVTDEVIRATGLSDAVEAGLDAVSSGRRLCGGCRIASNCTLPATHRSWNIRLNSILWPQNKAKWVLEKNHRSKQVKMSQYVRTGRVRRDRGRAAASQNPGGAI